MNARSILTTAALASLVTLLGAGCGAPPSSDSTGSDQSAMKAGNGGGLEGVMIRCGGYYQFDQNDSLQQALSSLGCSPPRYAFAINAWQTESVTYCPVTYLGWLQALADTDMDVSPYYTALRSSGGTTCSGYTKPIPDGTVEFSFDPNCTGSSCGSLRAY